MIKFFRKIRQSLLSKNKFSKYLIYAIGEIVLVVVGILLALSINEWNQNKKNLKKSNSYIERIISDIVQDTIVLKNFINEQTPREKQFKNYFSYIKQGDVAIEQLKDTLNNFKTFTGFVEFTSTTYNQLVASGNFELINEDKRITIINYYKFCNVFMERVESFENSMKNESAESRKYLDIDSASNEFFESINQKTNAAFISQGLKHRHNRISLDQKKWNLIMTLNKTYNKIAKATIQKLNE